MMKQLTWRQQVRNLITFRCWFVAFERKMLHWGDLWKQSGNSSHTKFHPLHYVSHQIFYYTELELLLRTYSSSNITAMEPLGLRATDWSTQYLPMRRADLSASIEIGLTPWFCVQY